MTDLGSLGLGKKSQENKPNAEFSFIRVLPSKGIIYVTRNESCQSLPWEAMLALKAVPEGVEAVKYKDDLLISGADWVAKLSEEYFYSLSKNCSLSNIVGSIYIVSRCWIDKSGIPTEYVRVEMAAEAFVETALRQK